MLSITVFVAREGRKLFTGSHSPWSRSDTHHFQSHFVASLQKFNPAICPKGRQLDNMDGQH